MSTTNAPLFGTPPGPRRPQRIAVVVGTRPEAIKLAPVILRLDEATWAEPAVITTGQHDDVVVETLAYFGLRPHIALENDWDGGSLPGLTAVLVQELGETLRASNWDAVIVQGDTSSTFCAALAAFYAEIPVVHVEAGLRSGNAHSPFPEEGHRRLLVAITSLHLPPTSESCTNLHLAGVAEEQLLTTGNTVIDAVVEANRRPCASAGGLLPVVRSADSPVVLVTAHRRENWGRPLRSISRAVSELSRRNPHVRFVVAAHMNPEVRSTVESGLHGLENVSLPGPVPYGPFSHLLARAHLMLTDSGGIQEEASAFGAPVLVMRDATERVEGVRRGIARIIGTDRCTIVATVEEELRTMTVPAAGASSSRDSPARIDTPYGDGHAAARCAAACGWMLGLTARPEPFRPQHPATTSVR